MSPLSRESRQKGRELPMTESSFCGCVKPTSPQNCWYRRGSTGPANETVMSHCCLLGGVRKMSTADPGGQDLRFCSPTPHYPLIVIPSDCPYASPVVDEGPGNHFVCHLFHQSNAIYHGIIDSKTESIDLEK
jgi:hypothetical protein